MSTEDECYELLRRYKGKAERLALSCEANYGGIESRGFSSSPLLFALCLAAKCDIEKITKTYVYFYCGKHLTSHSCGIESDVDSCLILSLALQPYVKVPLSKCPCAETNEEDESPASRGMLESDKIYNPRMTAMHIKLVCRFNQTRALIFHLASTIVSFFNTITDPAFKTMYDHIQIMRRNKLHKKQHQMRHGRNATVGDLLTVPTACNKLKDCHYSLSILQKTWIYNIKECSDETVKHVKRLLGLAIAFLFSKEGGNVVELLAKTANITVTSKSLIIIMVIFPTLRFTTYEPQTSKFATYDPCILNSMLLNKNLDDSKPTFDMNIYTNVQTAYVSFLESSPKEFQSVEEYMYIEDLLPFQHLWTNKND